MMAMMMMMIHDGDDDNDDDDNDDDGDDGDDDDLAVAVMRPCDLSLPHVPYPRCCFCCTEAYP